MRKWAPLFMTSLIATPFLDDGPFQVPPPTKNQIMMGLENVACPLFLVSDLSNVSSCDSKLPPPFEDLPTISRISFLSTLSWHGPNEANINII